jgi:hypothetical protein
MLRKVLPLLLGVAGLAGGVGAGIALRPDAKPADDHAADKGAEAHADEADAHAEASHAEDPTAPEYVKLNNQFVIPVVEDGRVAALVVLALSLEVEAGSTETVYEREPKLRDVFLQVMFDHANVGGFSGSFTDGTNLLVLRTSLKEGAALILGPTIRDVLITDIARQDS